MSNRIRKAKYENIKRLNESLNSSGLLNEACINAGNDCTAAISCGGESNYHGTVSFACTCNTPAGNFGSGWIDCGPASEISGGGTTGIEDFEFATPGGDVLIPNDKGAQQGGYPCDPEDCPTDDPDCCEDSYVSKNVAVKGKTRLKEDCGCSSDKTHDNWIDNNLSKIDQMVGAPNAGDMGTGGCPPGQHFCAASNSCREDNPPQMEPLTLMGVDVINLQEQIMGSLNKNLLVEAYFGILDHGGMNDFCNGCGSCCGLTGVHYNFLGLPSGVDLECVGCGSYAPGTVFDENGNPMGQSADIPHTVDDGGGNNTTTTNKPHIDITRGLSGSKTKTPPKSSPKPQKDILNMREGYKGVKRLLKEAEMDCMSMSDAWACANFAIDCLNGGDIPYTNPSENSAQGYVTVYCDNGNSAVPPGAVTFSSAAEVEAYHAGFGGPLEADYEKTKSFDTGSGSVGGFGKGSDMMFGKKGNMGESAR